MEQLNRTAASTVGEILAHQIGQVLHATHSLEDVENLIREQPETLTPILNIIRTVAKQPLETLRMLSDLSTSSDDPNFMTSVMDQNFLEVVEFWHDTKDQPAQ